MDSEVFDHFRELIHKESGIYLPSEKRQLLMNRIAKRIRSLQLKSESEYLNIIESDATGEELRVLLDAISTNVTHFYREERHFEILGPLIEEAAQQGRNPIRIWSAACSSGEEPYTMSMVAEEALGHGGPEVKILATDISTRVLDHALRGRYQERQLERVPLEWKKKYFQYDPKDQELSFVIKPTVSERVLFKRLNLAVFPYPLKGDFDVIFCRNVMIYFQRELREQIVNEMFRMLRPGGHLFLSHSENLLGIDHPFETVATAVYRRPGGES